MESESCGAPAGKKRGGGEERRRVIKAFAQYSVTSQSSWMVTERDCRSRAIGSMRTQRKGGGGSTGQDNNLADTPPRVWLEE